MCFVPAGRFELIHRAWRIVVDGCASEAEWQAAFERRGVAFGDELVLGGTAFLLSALGCKQVTKAGRAADKLAGGGELEAFCDGLFGLLHEKRKKTQGGAGLGKGNLGKFFGDFGSIDKVDM